MRLSHSKLSTILSCPMTYYLQYKLGITLRVEKTALNVGSAVHWGIENNTEDLTGYFNKDTVDKDQLLAEAMVHGYFTYKNQIFDELLTDVKTGTKATLLEEQHELFIDGKLKSYTLASSHIFVGIIDLLLLTDKGFIVVDYKTSSEVPDWDKYLEQLYRYIFLLRSEFPGVPIYKIAIINLRKSRMRPLKNENDKSFSTRLKQEYALNSQSLVNWHVFSPANLDENLISAYIDNLSRMADTAEMIDTNQCWYINYGNADAYGGSPYKSIFYHIPDCYLLYKITDKIYNHETNAFDKSRPCKPLDMMVIDTKNILNKYEQFKAQAIAFYIINEDIDKQQLFDYIKKNYIVDDELLEEYWDTLSHDITQENKNN